MLTSTDGALTQERALHEITQRLASAHPWASEAHIEAILRANLDETRDAKVQNFRLLLAERNARVRLRSEEPSCHQR